MITGRTGARLAAALVVACCGTALAAPLDPQAGFEITAHSIEYVDRGELYVADGDVLIVQGETRLSADWMAFSMLTRRGVASGRIRLDDGQQIVEAAFMHFDIDDLAGILFEGKVDTGAHNLLITGRELEKTGDVDFRVRDGTFTACRCPEETNRPPWRFDTKDADVELGGYGKAKNSTIDVLGVPILWIPWMMFPVKTERESGLLFPEFAFGGRNGFQFGVPVFWAARHDLGVVVTPGYMQERGASVQVDVDYVVGEKSRGRLYGALVLDKTASSPLTSFERERWALAFEHDQYLPWGWRARADVKLVSDNLYLQDFDNYAVYRNDLFLRSSVFAFRHFGGQGRIGVTGALLHADDIQSIPLLDRDDLLQNRLPDLSVHALRTRPAPVDWLGLVTSLDTDYSYFWSKRKSADILEAALQGPNAAEVEAVLRSIRLARLPEFELFSLEGAPMLENGHRFSLFPRLARPVAIGGMLDLFPEVGYAETLYGGEVSGFDERGIFTASADLRSRLRGQLKAPGLPAVSHLVEPFVKYTWVRPRSQSGTPVYVPRSLTPQRRLRHLAPENRVLDPSDRVSRSNVLAIGLDNRLRLRERGGGLGEILSELQLSYEYDWDRDDDGQLVVDGRSFYRHWVTTHFSAALDVEGSHLDEANAGMAVRLPPSGPLTNNWAGVRYRYLRDVPAFTTILPQSVNQLDVSFGFQLLDRLQLRYGVVYSFEDDARIGSGGTILYASKCRCWAFGVDITEDRTHDIYFGFRYSITGLGDDSGDPFRAVQQVFSGLSP